jgi:hypothetical protein
MIDESEFAGWKKLPVTKALFSRLQEVREEVEQQMLNSEVIMSGDSTRLLSQLVGLRNGIDLTINISLDDIKPEEVSNADTQPESSGI